MSEQVVHYVVSVIFFIGLLASTGVYTHMLERRIDQLEFKVDKLLKRRGDRQAREGE